MTRRQRPALLSLAFLAALSLFATPLGSALPASAQLQIVYSPGGLEQLRYGGTLLEDVSHSPSDAFHIWHMKMTDLQGHLLTQKQYAWGENNLGRVWDAGSHSWTYSFPWGSIRVQFQQAANTLNLIVTETNRDGSGVILDGATIYPLALHMPALPRGFQDPHYAQVSLNSMAPGVTLADWNSGEVAAVIPDAAHPLYSGFEPQGTGTAYYPIVSATPPDSLAKFQPHQDRPVLPGHTDTFSLSLRFASSGAPLAHLAADAYANWARVWPVQLHWTDRRPIGTVYLASAPSSNVYRPEGSATNPRHYFSTDGGDDGIDIKTPDGIAAFQTRVLTQAETNVVNMKRLGAQGAITWDIEGEQYPQNTSYVCAPDQIAQIAPEMESVISDSQSPYHGMKLDDAYFRIMTRAGLRVGVCVRPQHFTSGPNGSAQQIYLPLAQIEAELARKMHYAHDRWGVTLFYVDSTVERDGSVLDAGLFQRLAKALPDSLIMPEESTPRYYAYTAPFRTFLFHGDIGTDPDIYAYYPAAFSVNLINDADPGKLAAARPQLASSVHRGDVLMGLVTYWQANNTTIDELSRAVHPTAGSTQHRSTH